MASRHEDVVSQGIARAPGPSSSQPSSQGLFSMPFSPGEIINGKYEVVELIGIGGLGFVVAANHVELGEKVALKFLRPEAMSNVEAVSRFSREARASAKLRSEHVARVFDVGTLPDGSPFIVMEYLEGIDLGGLLHERGALPISLAIEYVLQTCEALATAHASGVVHRDIKPDNLFLNRRARDLHVIKVLDFGISKVSLARSASETRHPLVETTMAMGSPIYMSPEQIRAAKDIDARTDIWSLGCVLYELLTNRLAFDASSVTEVTAFILEREAPSLRSARPDVPEELALVIQRCLAKQPGQRFQNVGELAIALAPFAPPRARVLIERCCSILQSAGMARGGIERFRSPPPPTPDSALVGPISAGASSTSTVEASIRFVPPTSRSWPLVLAALILVAAGAAGTLVRNGVRDAEPEVLAPLAAPVAAAPSEGPSAASLPPPSALATPAPADRERPAGTGQPEHVLEPSSVAAGGSPPLAGEATARPEGGVPSSDRVGDGSRAPAAASPVPATMAAPAAPNPSAAPRDRLEPPRPKPAQAAPSRRRVSAPAPKPKPAPSPRSTPAPPEEPDIGF
jgi:eukaryotic-like serine/threonine-protein kinase